MLYQSIEKQEGKKKKMKSIMFFGRSNKKVLKSSPSLEQKHRPNSLFWHIAVFSPLFLSCVKLCHGG
jgi:hypothetical protein